jgi:hypothetical protein
MPNADRPLGSNMPDVSSPFSRSRYAYFRLLDAVCFTGLFGESLKDDHTPDGLPRIARSSFSNLQENTMWERHDGYVKARTHIHRMESMIGD